MICSAPSPRSVSVERALQQGADAGVGEPLEAEQAGARQQGRVHLEIGVLGRRADQDDRAVLDMRQQGVLLRLVPAVDLIDEQNGLLPVLLAPLPRPLDHLAHIGDAGGDRAVVLEGGPRRAGDDLRQGRFAAAGRPPEDRGGQLVALDGAPQQRARPDDALLPGKLLQRARAHPRRQRRIGIRLRERNAGRRRLRLQTGLVSAGFRG